MKNSYHVRHTVAIAMLFVLMLLTASSKKTYGQIAQAQILGVSQAIDGTMSPAPLCGFHVTFTYVNLGSNPVWLNIWARMPGQQNTAWVAMNICLNPFHSTRLLERSISLKQLGVPDNMRLSALLLAAQQSSSPLINPTPPPLNFTSYNCPLDSLFMFDSRTKEFAGAGGPAYVPGDFAGPVVANIARGCDVPNEDLDNSAHGPNKKTGYAGDHNACGPAAVANSLAWLQAAVPAVGSDGLSARDRLEELSGLMGRKKKGDLVTNQDIIQAKMSFIAKHKLKIKVEFLGASGDFDEDVKWLDDQYKARQDVELDYSYIDNEGVKRGHVAVLTDVNITGKVPQISVKDDKKQDKPGGNAEEKNLQLTEGPKGNITFVRNGRVCTVNNMYAESYDPAAGTVTDPNNPGGTTVSFCELNAKKTCTGACPALIVYYDENGKPVTTYPICAGKKTCCDINELFTIGSCKNPQGKCKAECPLLYRSKIDAKRHAHPVRGKCDEESCHCVYEFEAPKDRDDNRMIQQQPIENRLNIYPNPAGTEINIAVKEMQGQYDMQVVNLLGQKVMDKTIQLEEGQEVYTIDISNFVRGIHYVVLTGHGVKIGGMFVKE